MLLTIVIIILTVLFVPNQCPGMLVRMSEPAIKVFDNSNITVICTAEPSVDSPANVSLSVRARMVLTFLQVPRGGQMHQVHGTLHCDPARTNCESEFNLAVECITARINISQPMDTLETACQLVDEQICSHQWLIKHRQDCVALGLVTIYKGQFFHSY